MKELENRKTRGAWDNGVNVYAIELLEDLEETEDITRENLLNGASDWNSYSWGGSSLIYNCDIAERLCSPSEFRRKRGGDIPPNSKEDWLDVQGRALFQACNRIMKLVRK